MAENILHFGALRLRVTGSGFLKMRLTSLDDTRTTELLPLTMSNTSGREPARLCNFMEQRARYKVYTTEINENFKINRIIVFIKPTYTSYPG